MVIVILLAQILNEAYSNMPDPQTCIWSRSPLAVIILRHGDYCEIVLDVHHEQTVCVRRYNIQ